MTTTSGLVHLPRFAKQILRWCQGILFFVGIGGIGYAGFTLLEEWVTQDIALREIAANAQAANAQMAVEAASPQAKMIEAGGIVGRLDIARLGISVAVFEGTNSKVLRLGVGHVEGTPFPSEQGNSVLAAHRDTFFRALKDARVSDLLDVQSSQGLFHYEVDWVKIVAPNDVSVLRPTPGESTLTLVTCYPFYFVGPAPKRFVVHAVRSH